MMNAEKINMDHEGVEVPDYYGEDGLLHCDVCHEPKEAYLPEGKEWLGRKTHPRMCLCDRTEYERQEKTRKTAGARTGSQSFACKMFYRQIHE